MKRIIHSVLMMLVVSTTTVVAGDVGFGAFKFPVNIEYVGEEAPVEFELKNSLGFDVTGLKLTLQIRFGADLVYNEVEELDKVEKNSDLTFKMSVPFSIDRSGEFRVNASFETDGSDINPSNNQTEYTFSAEYRVGLQDALSKFDASFPSVLQQYTGSMTVSGEQIHYTPMPIKPGSRIRMADKMDVLDLGTHSYLFLFDLAPYQKMSHVSGFMLVNANNPDATPSVEVGQSWTEVDGMPVSSTTGPAFTLYNDLELTTQTEQDPPIVSVPISNDPPTTTCAILIAGRRNPKGSWDDHTNVFKGDVDSVYKEITTESSGMKCDPANVERLYDPNEEDLFNAVERLKEKGCTRLLFYYSGHGFKTNDEDKYACLFLKGGAYPGLPMYSAMDYIAEVGAKDHVLIFDCCYAGDAIRQRTESSGLAGKNVIILASSHADSLSKTDIRITPREGGGQDTTGRSEYTKALLESWGAKGISTPLQAHNDVVKRDPKLRSNGQKINESMKPQSYGTETVPATNGNISFDELDLEFADASGFDPNATITVTTWGPVGDFGTTDATVNTASSYRAWNISLGSQMSAFTTSITFDYEAGVDGVEGVTPGIIRREMGSAWSALPTEVDADARTLTVRAISSFSDWAVAHTTLDPVSVSEQDPGTMIGLRMRSSVNSTDAAFDVTAQIGGQYRGAIVELHTGRVVSQFALPIAAGTTTRQVPTADLAAGVYIMTLTSDAQRTASRPFIVIH